MRIATGAGVLMLALTLSAPPLCAQTLPGGLTAEQMKAIPPGVLQSLPADILTKVPLSTLQSIPPDLFRNIPPDLLAKIPPDAATMTPEQAKAYYKSLDPATQRSLKEKAKEIKAQIESVPGLKEKLLALIQSLRGS